LGQDTGPSEKAWICTKSSHVFTIPHWRERSLPPAAVRVESVPWQSAELGTQLPPNISANITQRRDASTDGPFRAAPASAGEQWISYNLPAEPAAGDWRFGRGTVGTQLVAVPLVTQDSLSTTRLAVTNTVPRPGVTNAVLLVYDANGAVATRCLRLPAGGTVVSEAGALSLPDTSFRGSAIISAASWRHPVSDTRGRVTANLVGLAALAVYTRNGGAQPGDTSAAETGWPFALEDPVNPFESLAPDCVPLPPMVAEPPPGRAYLPRLDVTKPSR
jgi:hypothetical protein